MLPSAAPAPVAAAVAVAQETHTQACTRTTTTRRRSAPRACWARRPCRSELQPRSSAHATPTCCSPSRPFWRGRRTAWRRWRARRACCTTPLPRSSGRASTGCCQGTSSSWSGRTRSALTVCMPPLEGGVRPRIGSRACLCCRLPAPGGAGRSGLPADPAPAWRVRRGGEAQGHAAGAGRQQVPAPHRLCLEVRQAVPRLCQRGLHCSCPQGPPIVHVLRAQHPVRGGGPVRRPGHGARAGGAGRGQRPPRRL